MDTGQASADRRDETGDALEQLLASAAGSVIYDQLARLAAEWIDFETRIGHSYQTLLRLLVEDFAADPSSARVLELCATVIRSRHDAGSAIVPASSGLRPADLASRLEPDARLRAALTGLARRLSGAPPASVVATSTPVPTPPPTAGGDSADRVDGSLPAGTEQRVNTAYRQHLDRQRDEIEKLQMTLTHKVREAIAQNKEFGDLLSIERGALQQAESLGEVTSLRTILLGGIDELLSGQQALAENLASTSEVLQLIESDSSRLQDELHKVRLLSLTDESTGLPNRRAFMRRLDDEIGRAQRYANPLALAILDLDEFKAVNDRYGHAAGDQVLRCYADQVLSIFRHHDMVARYGGEEFAVLLPNTTPDGALAALRKVQLKVAASQCEYGGETRPLPTFSAGTALLAPGESSAALIDRADRALYRAKHFGRNRIEMDVSGALPRKAGDATPGPAGSG